MSSGANSKSAIVRWEGTYMPNIFGFFKTAYVNGDKYDPLNGLPWLGMKDGTQTVGWKLGKSALVTKVEIMPSYFNGTWWV